MWSELFVLCAILNAVCINITLSVCLCVCSTAVRGQSTPDLGEKFLKDLKGVKDRSGPLPLWLSKASHYSRGDVTDGTPMAALEIQSQDSDRLATTLQSGHC